MTFLRVIPFAAAGVLLFSAAARASETGPPPSLQRPASFSIERDATRTRGAEPDGHRELELEGSLESRYFGDNTMFLRVDRVRNNRRSGVSGRLRLALWASAERPVFGEVILAYTLGTYEFGTLPAGGSASNLHSGSVPFSRPNDGIYHMTFVLQEYDAEDGVWYYYDFFVFNHRDTFGTSPCTQTRRALCLNAGRFHVWTYWETRDDAGTADAEDFTTDTGYFWFFSPSNVELVVKVLDGRALNNSYWVFYGALTDVEYLMKVTDTKTGATKTYYNAPGNMASFADTSAFFEGSSGGASLPQSDAERVARDVSRTLLQAILGVRARGTSEQTKERNLGNIYVPIGPLPVGCANGGKMETSGSLSGNVDDGGSGALFLQLLITATDCRMGGMTINGDPYMSATGTFTFFSGAPATQQNIRIGGGFKFIGPGGAGACLMNLGVTVNLNTGTGSVNGTVCAQPVNLAF